MDFLIFRGLEGFKLYTKFPSMSSAEQDKPLNDQFVRVATSEEYPLSNKDLEKDELVFDFLPTTTHIVNTSTSGPTLDITQESHAAPAVSMEAGLELFEPRDKEINLADKLVCPVIFDTGASLAITGNQADFLPNSLKPITTLKLGGMAAGASIIGVGNVAWTFPCDN